MIENRSLIQKADLQLSDLLTDGGLLVPAQAAKFIRTLIDESVIMPMAAVTPMRSHTHLLEKARFGSRVLRAGTEGQALTSADRSKLDLEKVELSAELFKAEVRLSTETLEDNIERNTLRQTVMSLLSERIALDMDEIIIHGDTTSTDAYLAKFDGILKQASTNLVNNLGAKFSTTTMKKMLQFMPTEFMRNKKKMRFLVSVDTDLEYRDSIAGREDQVGGNYLEKDVPPVYSGVPIIDVPLFPEDVGANESQALLCDPKNINVGIWRKIKIETDKDISAGVMVIVATLRFDVKYVEERAVVRAYNISVD